MSQVGWCPAVTHTAASLTFFIPAYNGAAFIAEAIESCLGHDYSPDEVIVVDDASTDNTAGMVEGYPEVTLLRHETNRGQAAARNTALAAASGEFVAALDQDDRNLPCPEQQICAYRRHSREYCSVVGPAL